MNFLCLVEDHLIYGRPAIRTIQMTAQLNAQRSNFIFLLKAHYIHPIEIRKVNVYAKYFVFQNQP
jgi:hypothetical protein